MLRDEQDLVAEGVLWSTLGGLKTLMLMHVEPKGCVQCFLNYQSKVTFSCRAEKMNLDSLFLMKIWRRFSEMAN